MTVPYVDSQNLKVLPDNLSTGTGGNTAQYESTGSYNMHGGFISQHQPKSRRGKSKRGKSRRGKQSQRNKSNRKKNTRRRR